VRSLAQEARDRRSLGILLGRLDANGNVLGSTGGRIAANSILGPQDGILLLGNDAGDVLENRIESPIESPPPGRVRFGIAMVASSRVRVHGNRITNAEFPITANGGTANEIVGNTLLRGGGGATLRNQISVEFSQNRVEDMRAYGLISIGGLAKCAIIENRFLFCGYLQEQQEPAFGIGVSQHFGELHIASCEVMNTGVSPVSPNNEPVRTLAWGIFADFVLEARVQSNNVTYADAARLDPNLEHRALWLRGWLEQDINPGTGQIILGFSAQILDNKFLGPGRSALVEVAQGSGPDDLVRRFERVFFNNNFCWHVSVRADNTATVSLVGRSAIVMGHHIKANAPIPSVDFHDMEEAVYMGNIAQRNPTRVSNNSLPLSIPGFFNKP
jgi:hypothetical protein